MQTHTAPLVALVVGSGDTLKHFAGPRSSKNRKEVLRSPKLVRRLLASVKPLPVATKLELHTQIKFLLSQKSQTTKS